MKKKNKLVEVFYFKFNLAKFSNHIPTHIYHTHTREYAYET